MQPIELSAFAELDFDKLNELTVDELRSLAGYKKPGKDEPDK
jgi:hypothetical protein